MSWDEQDWSTTWIVGNPKRFGKTTREPYICTKSTEPPWFIDDYIKDGERTFHFYQRSKNIRCISDGDEARIKLEEIAKTFGVEIKYIYLWSYHHHFDYRQSEPLISEDEIQKRDLIEEVLSIV